MVVEPDTVAVVAVVHGIVVVMERLLLALNRQWVEQVELVEQLMGTNEQLVMEHSLAGVRVLVEWE